ncbi:hypothetical protein FACS1894111_02630 [Clostridia bacterium]|nr:hypothetical protein FACS1894111_02630 [Clostridia bacterium]
MDVSQYLEIFIDETSGHLQDLSDSIMILEKDSGNLDTVNEIFRAAHSLKGMAGTMGFKRMQKLTHQMENLFQEVRSGNMSVSGSIVDVLFQCLDALDSYLENIKATSGEGTEDNESIVLELARIAEGGDDPVPVAAPAAEPVKVAAPANGGSRASTANYEEGELVAAQKAEDAGKKLYGFTAYLASDCMLKAARAFLVFSAVEAYGQIVAYSPNTNEIEEEKFENEFSFILATDQDVTEAYESAATVSEIEKLEYEPLRYADLEERLIQQEEEEFALHEEPKAAAPAQAATPTAPPPAPAAAPKPAPASPAAPAAAKTAAAAPAAAKTVAKPVANRTIRVDIEKLDALMNQVSELIIAKNSLVSIRSMSSGDMQNQNFHEQIEYLERITTGLHESVMKVRMVPIESVVNKFPRMIRDLSRKLDKKMELYMTGEDTELDRTVVDQIGDPLQHLLRNSADHGLEDAHTRKERRKPETGSIFLNAFQEGNTVIIEVRDDGAGIDTERVKSKAIERGVITSEQGESMSQKEIIDLLFLPSFSMADKITDISGRGVGLDVVKSNIQALGGDVEVKSNLGEGTKFTVRLPLTLAIIQALMVEVEDEKYAVALGSIQTIEDIAVSDIKYVQAEEVIHIRGLVIPLIRLKSLLDIKHEEEQPEEVTVVIVKKGDKLAGLVVDNLIGQQEIVIKSLGKYINSTRYISGATILGDGEVALILDVNTLI